MVTSPHLIGVVLAAFVAICLTGQALAIRFGTQDGKANDALVVVFVINVLVFTSVVIVQDYGSYRLTVHSIGAFVAAGLTGTLLGTGFYYLGIEQVGASRSDTIKASQPLTATVLAILVLGVRITPQNVIDIVLVVAGVANTLSLVAYCFALKVTTVAVVIPIVQTSPLFVIGVSYYLLSRLERITPRLVAGGICIVVGAVVVPVFG